PPQRFDKLPFDVMAAPKLKFLRRLIVLINRSTVGTAQLDSVRGYARQYGFEVQSRADGLTNLTQRFQFPNRLRQLARPRLQFLEQSHVLDRNYRLICKGFEQSDLLFGEWTDLVATNLNVADGEILSEERNTQGRAMSALPCERAPFRKLHPFRLKIVNVKQSPIDHCSTAQRSTVKRNIAGRDWAVMRDKTQDTAIDAQDHDIDRFAKPGRAARDGVEYRLDIRRGTGNRAEDLARCSLLL